MVKDLGFCEVELHDSYLTCVVREGVTLSVEKCQQLIENTLDYFNNEPFVYITHRVNSYAVDPAVYKDTSLIKNLAGFAVVSKNHQALKNAEIEKLFLKKPFEIFKELNEAKTWAETIVKKKSLILNGDIRS